MPSLDQLLVFLPAALLVAISPGANNLLALRNGFCRGAGDAIAALGRPVAAFAVMVALVAAGLASVLAGSQLAFEAIKWAGLAYLLYLGVRSLLESRDISTETDPQPRSTGASRRGRLGLARQELVVAACGWATAGSRVRSSGLSHRARRRLEQGTGAVFVWGLPAGRLPPRGRRPCLRGVLRVPERRP